MPNLMHFWMGFSGDGCAGVRYALALLFGRLIHIRDLSPHSAALNMALDEVLLTDALEPLLRIYRWAHPSVSFGYFARYEPVVTSWPGREIVRRMTGGGVVPHGEDLTYSLIVPDGHGVASLCPRDIYRRVHETLATLIAKAGAMPTLAPAKLRGHATECFESPAEFDLLVNGRKIAGAAMRRTRGGLLLQGSVQELPELENLRPSLPLAFGAEVIAREILPSALAGAESLARSKYSTREWTERV
jgi:lipoate-protein ligase A